MPLYDYRCDGCGKVREEFRTYEARDDAAQCECGEQVKRVWMPSQVVSDIAGYQSMIDGTWIGSRAQHREHLKRHGCIEVGNERPKHTGPINISREAIRSTMRETVERMKARGTFVER